MIPGEKGNRPWHAMFDSLSDTSKVPLKRLAINYASASCRQIDSIGIPNVPTAYEWQTIYA